MIYHWRGNCSRLATNREFRAHIELQQWLYSVRPRSIKGNYTGNNYVAELSTHIGSIYTIIIAVLCYHQPNWTYIELWLHICPKDINPLRDQIIFFVVFRDITYKIGSFRLPNHRRDVRRKFYWWSLLKIELKFRWKGTPCVLLGVKGLNAWIVL